MNRIKVMKWVRTTSPGQGPDWQVDTIRLANRNEVLAFKGTDSGHFIRLEEGGEFELGRYDGAYPNITDGVFMPDYQGVCTREEAFDLLRMYGIDLPELITVATRP